MNRPLLSRLVMILCVVWGAVISVGQQDACGQESTESAHACCAQEATPEKPVDCCATGAADGPQQPPVYQNASNTAFCPCAHETLPEQAMAAPPAGPERPQPPVAVVELLPLALAKAPAAACHAFRVSPPPGAPSFLLGCSFLC
jgi:hypothetical protein